MLRIVFVASLTLLASLGASLAQTPATVRLCVMTAGVCVPLTASAPLPVTVSGGGGGAVTIANGADVAEGSTTDAPAATPTTVAPATSIALLKALNNGITILNFPATQPVSGTVTANAGTNLNTSLLALESGGNIASLVTQIGAVTASPTTNTVLDRLKTINATLSSPFQAGGSIGNTAFGISGTLPAYAATPTFNLGTLNGAATAANQSTMATNQTGGGQKTQIVDGSGNVISATANALDINIKSGSATVAASENHIGEVGGNILPITNAMTTSNATVTTGQSIGGIQTLANAVRVSGSLGASGTSGIIQSVVLTFLDAVGSGPLDVYFYNATATTGSNCQNATTFVLQTADRTNVLGLAHVTDFTSSNTAVVAQANNLAIPFGLASGTSLFACVVARGSFAITGTANASIKVNVLRN